MSASARSIHVEAREGRDPADSDVGSADTSSWPHRSDASTAPFTSSILEGDYDGESTMMELVIVGAMLVGVFVPPVVITGVTIKFLVDRIRRN